MTTMNASGHKLQGLGELRIELAIPNTSCEPTSHIYEDIESPLLTVSTLKVLGYLTHD